LSLDDNSREYPYEKGARKKKRRNEESERNTLEEQSGCLSLNRRRYAPASSQQMIYERKMDHQQKADVVCAITHSLHSTTDFTDTRDLEEQLRRMYQYTWFDRRRHKGQGVRAPACG
jgi:hypothetical protein